MVNASLGESNAYLAETCGLQWAAVVAALPPVAGVVFRADNQAALAGVAGKADMSAHPACVCARCFCDPMRSPTSMCMGMSVRWPMS